MELDQVRSQTGFCPPFVRRDRNTQGNFNFNPKARGHNRGKLIGENPTDENVGSDQRGSDRGGRTEGSERSPSPMCWKNESVNRLNVVLLLLALFLLVGLLCVFLNMDAIVQESVRRQAPVVGEPPLRRELRAMAELRRLEYMKDAMSKKLWLHSRRWPTTLKSLFAYIRSLVGDDDYLVCVEANPGPGAPQERKKQDRRPPRQRNNQSSTVDSMRDELAKQKAELDVLKDKLKEKDSAIGQVTQSIKENALEEELRNQERQFELDQNSITFPEFSIPPVPPNYIQLGGTGEKIEGLIHICHLPATAVRGPAVLRRRLMIAIAVLSSLLVITFIYLSVVVGVNPSDMELKLWISFAIFVGLLGAMTVIVVYLIVMDQALRVRLVGVPRRVHTILTDDRPDFDRGEALGPQNFTDLDLCVELQTRTGEFRYMNGYKSLALPDFWFTDEVHANSRKLRRLNVNLSQLTDALNRKTLEIPKVSRFAQRVDRATRMVAANPKYQENYRRKLETGDSSQEDLLLLACVMLTRDAMVNPMDF